MLAKLIWKEGMMFNAESDGLSVAMDAKAPIGKGSAPTPKELVAMGLGGCTAMDVVALLKKHKQAFDQFTIDVKVTPTSGKHPVVFEKAEITFSVTGQVSGEILLDAVKKSQTQYCGVSAMLSKAHPITYVVVLNGETIGEGHADFH